VHRAVATAKREAWQAGQPAGQGWPADALRARAGAQEREKLSRQLPLRGPAPPQRCPASGAFGGTRLQGLPKVTRSKLNQLPLKQCSGAIGTVWFVVFHEQETARLPILNQHASRRPEGRQAKRRSGRGIGRGHRHRTQTGEGGAKACRWTAAFVGGQGRGADRSGRASAMSDGVVHGSPAPARRESTYGEVVDARRSVSGSTPMLLAPLPPP